MRPLVRPAVALPWRPRPRCARAGDGSHGPRPWRRQSPAAPRRRARAALVRARSPSGCPATGRRSPRVRSHRRPRARYRSAKELVRRRRRGRGRARSESGCPGRRGLPRRRSRAAARRPRLRTSSARAASVSSPIAPIASACSSVTRRIASAAVRPSIEDRLLDAFIRAGIPRHERAGLDDLRLFAGSPAASAVSESAAARARLQPPCARVRAAPAAPGRKPRLSWASARRSRERRPGDAGVPGVRAPPPD